MELPPKISELLDDIVFAHAHGATAEQINQAITDLSEQDGVDYHAMLKRALFGILG